MTEPIPPLVPAVTVSPLDALVVDAEGRSVPHVVRELVDPVPHPTGRKLKRMDRGYPEFRRTPPSPPNTPSPPRGMLTRDATAFVRGRHASFPGIDPRGVSYLARFLVMHVEEDWGQILDTWGAGAFEAHARTGVWSH